MTRRNPDSRERLLRAARAEFARHGRAGGRTDRIARLAGVNKQLIHYYFKTKAGLYQATLERAGQEVAEAMGQLPLAGLTAVESLRRLVTGQFDYLAHHQEVTSLLTQSDDGGAWFGSVLKPLVGLLNEGQATGYFRDDIDPGHHARLALLLHLGYFALHPLTKRWGDPAAWRDRVAELIVLGCSW